MDRARKGSIRGAAAVVALAGVLAATLAATPAAVAARRVTRVHSVGTFAYQDGTTRTMVWDEGELTAVGEASVSLVRADGVALTTAASDAATCVRVDGLEARLENLVVGQDVAVVSDETGTQALAIHAGRPRHGADTIGCRLLRGAVHGDISDLLSDGTTRQRSWDRGRISLIAAHRIRILRADGESVTSIRTRETRVVNVSSYWRLRLGDPVTVVSLVTGDEPGQVRLFALRIRVHRR